MDSRVAGVLAEGCQKLTSEASVALRRAQNPEVIRLAESIYLDCSSYLMNQRALVETLGLRPGESAVQSRIQASAPAGISELSSQALSDFDRTFVERMVADQNEILGLAEGTLLPTTNHSELKALIEVQFNPNMRRNLATARQLQTDLREQERRNRSGV
ncbi:MAG: DUF4142 domain-containing protein [Polyangiaceae bacterium]|nr:DUF4142 domain-containing protein [Polyangiaceae bacterium]